MTMRTRTAGGPAPRRRPAPPRKIVEIPRAIMVRDLATLIGASEVEAVKALMKNGIMAGINQVIDYDTAALMAAALGWEAQPQVVAEGDSSAASMSALDKHRRSVRLEAGLDPRPAVITIMGHVDHGKTSLLDAIRQTNVTAAEAGGITQHVGAYQVEVNGQKLTFIDTPGHEAFTAMRARGAQITDIAVLVVAADDGVMPQTREAINHAQAAEVPILVAINKVDLSNANPDRIKQELTEYDIVVEEYGGDTICVNVSARTGEGIDDLLDNLLLLAEVLELRADSHREALGVVIEASMDQRRGALATLLVQTGTLEVGDAIAAGAASGRIKNMFDDRGHRVKKAGPSTPVVVLGLNDVPAAGDVFRVYKDEKAARVAAQQIRDARETADTGAARAMTLEDFSADVQSGQVKDLNVILKTDVQGSIDPIRSTLEKLSTDEVRIRILDSGSGNITENDVNLAIASKAVVIGFNNTIEPGAKRLADAENVDVRQYSVIYKITEDLEQAVSGLLEPKFVEVVEGRAEVLALFPAGRDRVAGSRVTEGRVTRGAAARVIRNGQTIAETTVRSLRRFREDVREVTEGLECGIVLEDFNDFAAGDVLEFVVQQRA
ncbi:MAG TPA: translation initiation factor IF-2 [Dehalococcoidia bacterium]|nr:translation initiation factor IF-2 [Dehalococcoidia bacterium]